MCSKDGNQIKDKHYPTVIILFLIAITLISYWSVQNFEFVNYDDDIYVTENIHVLSGITKENVIWAFTTFHASNWHPLTWLSLLFDYELYWLNPAGYHWTNVLLHIANTLLLFLVLNRMTGALWQSGFVAALFAVHPLHVESVAWVAERKDVLSTFFWMLTLYAYVFYVEHPDWKRYVFVFVSFSLGLMAKPMLVTLPFVLLLLDYWPLKRFPFKPSDSHMYSQQGRTENAHFSLKNISIVRLLLEKIPFIMLSIFSSIMTLFAQQSSGAIMPLQQLSLMERTTNAFVSYATYIFKMFWPADLAVFYPHPGTWPVWQVWVSILLFAGITMYVWKLRHHPYLRVGWLWYSVTLIPVIGIVQVGSQSIADRYTYIPLTGLFIMIAWGIPNISRQWRYKRPILFLSTGLVLLSLMICTWLQVRHWENGTSLFQHAVNVTEGNGTTINNLGNALARRGSIEEAILQYKEAITLQPNNAQAYNNMGKVLMLQGKVNEAIIYYSKAIQLDPRHMKAHFNIGVAYSEIGDNSEAILHYTEALKINPDFVAAYNNLGIIYANQNDLDKAVLYFQKALVIFPNYDSAKNNLRIASEQRDVASHRLQ
jgi:Flp pilus assembly protein TadD